MRFGGGASETMLHPIVAVALAIAIILMFVLPRRKVLAPLLLLALFTPLYQVVVVGGVHFTVIRILAILGLVRCSILGRSSERGAPAPGSHPIDRVVVLWAVFHAVVFSLQYMEMQAVIKSLGSLIDDLGWYFTLRFLIQDKEDIVRAVKLLVLVAAINSLGMINEQLTRQNYFWKLVSSIRSDGTPMSLAEIREGKIRAQGSFVVYLEAGVFGGMLLPLFIWLWKEAKSRFAALVGVVSSTIMVICSNSSTPDLAYVAGIFGLCLWPLRKRMRAIRWGLVITLTGLHLVMKAPVWALITRVDLTGSSSGYQRFMLVDNFIRHFWDWWLLGYRYYNDWGWAMWDLANQYVISGLQGGLVTFVCFVAIISRSFGGLGNARKAVEGDRGKEWFLWCLGASLFANVTAWFGCGYDSQMQVPFFTFLAIICTATTEALQSPRAAAPVETGGASSFEPVSSPIGAP